MVSYLILFKLGKMHAEGVRKFFWSQAIQKSAAIRKKILSVSSPSRTIHITIFHSKLDVKTIQIIQGSAEGMSDKRNFSKVHLYK